MYETFGIRTLWDLQQNQDIQGDAAWQEKISKKYKSPSCYQYVEKACHLTVTGFFEL